MKESVFVDTGYWIALFDKRDRRHKIAKKQLRPLFENFTPRVSDFILFETITYLNCSVKRHDLAVQFLGNVRASGLDVIRVDERTKADSLSLFKQYSDKFFSFTDCTSFAAMNRAGIQKFAGFDDHFQQMSFIPAFRT